VVDEMSTEETEAAWQDIMGVDTGNPSEALEFEPELHPRDEEGKFAEKPGVSDLGVDTSLDGFDGDEREAIKNGIVNFTETFDVSPANEVTTEFGGQSNDSVARAVWGEERVEIQPEAFSTERLEDWEEEGALVGSDLEYVVAHELGHLFHNQEGERTLDWETRNHREILNEEVSRRAASVPNEAIAELSAMIVQGEELSPELQEIWNTYGGPEI
jgi:hypothetical protein